jgi:hypothetical protein
MADTQDNQPRRRKKDPSGWLVISAFIVLFTIVVCVVIWLIFKDVNSADVVQRCKPGLCKFEIFTGRKTCPNPGDTVGIRLEEGNEYCTSADFCQQERYQCAVQSDQSIDCTGECDTPKCRCVANPALGLIGI